LLPKRAPARGRFRGRCHERAHSHGRRLLIECLEREAERLGDHVDQVRVERLAECLDQHSRRTPRTPRIIELPGGAQQRARVRNGHLKQHGLERCRERGLLHQQTRELEGNLPAELVDLRREREQLGGLIERLDLLLERSERLRLGRFVRHAEDRDRGR
jgi:hypothetical protein